MIGCEVLRRHADAFVDGELDPDTHLELEQHLTACGPCRVHLSFSRAFKSTVKEACVVPQAPPGLAERLRAALDAEDTRRRAADPAAPVAMGAADAGARPPLGIAGVRLVPMRARYAVPAAAAAVALAVIAAHDTADDDVSGGLAVQSVAAGSTIFEDIVRRHAHEHPAEVQGEPRQVASWFQGKLEFPVRPIAFPSEDVRLLGARLSNVSDREAAAFYYNVGGRRVTVMVFEPPAGLDRVAQHTRVQGRGIYYGRAGGRMVPVVEHEGLSYAFTGDLDGRALMRLAASAQLDR
ncbi:MAG: zf-HC2 domain-containing protein [Sandaracinaceae bacterium]|nr:zf-HC2 domain-containing protein [Sandaracinaceae bacterium]